MIIIQRARIVNKPMEDYKVIQFHSEIFGFNFYMDDGYWIVLYCTFLLMAINSI